MRGALLLLPAVLTAGVIGVAHYSASASPVAPHRAAVSHTVTTSAVRGLGHPARILLVGDSLAWESAGAFRLAIGPDAVVRTSVFPMTAICDFIDIMRTETETFRPDVVVAEFSGNSFTPCMDDGHGGRLTGAAKVARYEADAATAMSILTKHGATVYWAGAPVFRSHPSGNDGVLALYKSMPARYRNARFIDAGSSVTPDGTYVDRLPCSSVDACAPGTTSVVVRSPDGIHLCPTGMNDECPVPASGALRFGFAMAGPVRHDLGL